jgi:secreted trypsin-like serine protease
MKTVNQDGRSGVQMKKTFLFPQLLLLSFMLASCGAQKHSDVVEDGDFETGDIVNGKSVSAKNVLGHSVVALVSENEKGESLCTGSLISSGVVLTAAHCVEHNPKSMKIIFALDVHKAKESSMRDVDKFVKNPNWTHHLDSGEGDLALVHFKGNVPAGYVPLKLAPEKLELKIGKKITIIGYGVTDGESKTNSGKLRQTSSEIIDRKSETEMVTDGQQSSVCFGDSGGPAVIKNGKDIFQWGVASSVTNRDCTEASIHTEVMPYRDWIASALKKFRDNR